MNKILILVLSILLTSCAEPLRVYNMNDLQDQNCYKSFGAERGYCDIRLEDFK